MSKQRKQDPKNCFKIPKLDFSFEQKKKSDDAIPPIFPDEPAFKHQLTSNLFQNFYIVGPTEQQLMSIVKENNQIEDIQPKVLACFKGTNNDIGIQNLYFPSGYLVQQKPKRPIFFSTLKTDQLGERTYHHILVIYQRVEMDINLPSGPSFPPTLEQQTSTTSAMGRERMSTVKYQSPFHVQRSRKFTIDEENFQFTSSSEDQQQQFQITELEDEGDDDDDQAISERSAEEEDTSSNTSPKLSSPASPCLTRQVSGAYPTNYTSQNTKSSLQLPNFQNNDNKGSHISNYSPKKFILFAPVALAIQTKSNNFHSFRELLTDYIYSQLVKYQKHRAKRFYNVFQKLVLLNTLNLPSFNSRYKIYFRDHSEQEVLEFHQNLEDFPYHSPVPIRILFKQLQPKQVLLLFRAVLLNKSVVLVSDKLNLLFYIAEAVEQLMYPFRHSCVYIPITFDPGVISAPFPFVIGIQKSLCRESNLDNPHAIFFDLDQGTILLGNGDEADVEKSVPKIPQVDQKKLETELNSLLRPSNDDIDYAFPQQDSSSTIENSISPHVVMSDEYFAHEVRRIMQGFMFKYLSHFEVSKEEVKDKTSIRYEQLKKKMLSKFNSYPQAKQFVQQLVQTTGFQIWCQQYLDKRKFQLKYQILPFKPCSLQCPFTLYRPLKSSTEQLIIQIRCPQDPYKLLNLLQSAIRERTKYYQNDNKKQNTGDLTPITQSVNSLLVGFQETPNKRDDLMHSSPILASSQIFRARTDVGINCDAKLVSKLIINKIRQILDEEKREDIEAFDRMDDQEQDQQTTRLDSTCDVNKASIPNNFKINLQKTSTDQITQSSSTRFSVKKKMSLFQRASSSQEQSLSEMKRAFSGGGVMTSDLPSLTHASTSSPISVKAKPQPSKKFNFSLNIHQIHPLSPKRGITTKFFGEDDQLRIQEQPKISKRNHFQKLHSISGGKSNDTSLSNLFNQNQESKGIERAPSVFPIQANNSQRNSLTRKQSPKSIHPLNNVVKIFFGKKGFINFLNIIRRSLKGRKGDNSISFKEDLVCELLAIKQKFNLCRTTNGVEKQDEVSQYLANTHQGEAVSFAGQDLIQEQSNFPDSISDSDVGSLLMRPVSAAPPNIKISEADTRSQGYSYAQQIEATRPKYSNCLTLDRYASTKSQKSLRSVSTLPQTSILNFQYTSYKVCREFYQFHYFCASHLERYGDHSMKKQVLDCYIDGGKIKNECVPGKVIENYLSELNKAQIQSLHGKFFKQVIKTKPLLSRIISKIKQEKSKAMLRDKLQKFKTDNRMPNSRGSVSTDYQNSSRLGGVQDFTIDSKLNKHHFGKKQQKQESLQLSIEALEELHKYINSCEEKFEKRKKVMQTVRTYKSKDFTKICTKYQKRYASLDNFPKDDQTKAMFLLNTINFTILIRLIERVNLNAAPIKVYIWSIFLKQASIVINSRKFNLLELINVFLRNQKSRIYQTPIIHQMIKWPKFSELRYKSQLDFDLIVKEKYSDISLGIHFPLKQMPGFHIFTRKHKLEHQLQKIKHDYLNRYMRFEMNNNTQKMVVTLPKYFEWFILDFVEEADVVERQSLFIAQIANLSLNPRFDELRDKFENADIAISLEYSPVNWVAYKHLCQ